MADVIVTLPKWFGLEEWIAEGGLPGETWDGETEYHFYLGGNPPDIRPGERVYVCFNGRLIGYAPLVRVERSGRGYALVRRNGAVAVTIPERIQGFRGFRYRWWEYADERPFPEWQQGKDA